jgi:hypothetical protein
MAITELKDLVIKKMKTNPHYLDEQISVLDERVTLLKVLGVTINKDDEMLLEVLLEIRRTLPLEVQGR